MGELDPEGMAPENAPTLHAQAVWDFEFLMFPSGFLAVCDNEELTGHGTDTPKSTTVVHDGSIALNLAIDG